MRRALSLVLVPVVVAVLLLSVIIPALETRRVTRLLREITEVSDPHLSGETAKRLEEVEQHEVRALLMNAILVTVALAAIGVVVSLSRREGRLVAVLKGRAMSETALREAAEALAGAFTIDDVSQQVARSALDATEAAGTFVEHVGFGPDGSATLVVRGAAGTSVPLLGAELSYSGSLTEKAIEQDQSSLAADVTRTLHAKVQRRSGKSSATIVLPIRHGQRPVGALYIHGGGNTAFRAEDTRWAHTIAHLAALAYEKVELLDEARKGREKLERVMKSRQHLMRGFSHDVKNPLSAADGYADLLSTGVYGDLTDQQKETLRRIRRSIRRALDLIDDLHELARIETGNITVRREPVDLGDLARTNADEYRGAAYAAGLPLTLELAEDLPPVETDGARVRQIVGNLLSNAIKYTASGSIMLRVRPYPATAPASLANCVDIDVIDTGRGIPPGKQEVIFEEFTRMDINDRPGAGLGLAISQRLANALGGHIFVKSEVARGSTFTLRIPIHSPAPLPSSPVEAPGSTEPSRQGISLLHPIKT